MLDEGFSLLGEGFDLLLGGLSSLFWIFRILGLLRLFRSGWSLRLLLWLFCRLFSRICWLLLWLFWFSRFGVLLLLGISCGL